MYTSLKNKDGILDVAFFVVVLLFLFKLLLLLVITSKKSEILDPQDHYLVKSSLHSCLVLFWIQEFVQL